MAEQADIATAATTTAEVEDEIIRMSMLNYERLPMLDVIFERFVLSFSSSLKSLTGSVLDVTLGEVEYLPFADAMKSLPKHGLIAVAQADPWDDQFILSQDPVFLFSALELMLGGQPSGRAKDAKHGFTTIERRMGEQVAERILADMAVGFRQICEVSFQVDRMESNPQFANIAQPNSPTVRVPLKVSLEGYDGEVHLILPYATLEPVRPLLTKIFFGDRLGADSSWRTQLKQKIEESSVALTAQLHELVVPMREILDWKVGDTLDLRIDDSHPVLLLCAGSPVLEGEMGKKQNGSMALKVTANLMGKDEWSNDVDAD
ncbi:flagellar motor switch protein FliM [Thioclava sp. ES.031]|uniref:flagellar motor switch protein FliM n=1 Tax=Thioclava sp. ES.031 TaxID=1798203 RepID=UPI000BF71000|nr:FliM/FliN family flagellar motor switch protein [Thioclava sp. ES.031]PFG61899.1 flagellar motor switch protein FliM [Thioclava sp. ES.031]